MKMKLKEFAIILSFIAVSSFAQALKPALLNPAELQEGMMYIQLNHLQVDEQDHLEIKACTVSDAPFCFHLGQASYPLRQVNDILQQKISPMSIQSFSYVHGQLHHQVNEIEVAQARQFFILSQKINGASEQLSQKYFGFDIIEELLWQLGF